MTDPQFSRVIDQMLTAVLLVSTDGRIEWMNPAAESLLETSVGRAADQPLDEFFRDPSEGLAAICRVFRSGQSYTKHSADIVTVNGTERRLDYSVTPLDNGLLIECRDVDHIERINREAATLAARETSRQLVRGFAHEVKNPLGGIRGAAQLLERALERPELGEYIEVIIAEADRLSTLVDRMLGPASIPNHESTNIYRVLDRVIQLTAAEFGTINIIRDFDPSLPELLGDTDQLIQAFLNVMRNACQALTGRPEPHIKLITRVVRNYTLAGQHHRLAARIEIVDNGPGIPEELREQLFFPMISGRADGTGLGLSITQAILSRHGGAIDFESQPGETHFVVHLPLPANTETGE